MILSQHYLLLKTLHICGVVIFLGNIVVTAFWKVFADLSHDWRIVAFSQRLVTYTDICFTFLGIVLIAITGMLLASNYGNYWHVYWIFWGLSLFIASGVIWVVILIPLQIKLHFMANRFQESAAIPHQYWIYEGLWAIFGTIATILPFITLYFMVFKPS
ncbi:DUF2269 family protein [Legionella fallonii]|uniref:Putative membrane protein n=1 Tax=Legionella fallonii LLAP-10 TaxID=1212491 RepID=A0A098G0R7_9GAMM|nr:DUF2269 family protein [Legionella fallonii]CEG55559.1 putative membrane protein [Legionella fallonii LLAP-10]